MKRESEDALCVSTRVLALVKGLVLGSCPTMFQPAYTGKSSSFNLDLIQHDQIKVEFVRQVEGLPLLILCATQSRFDPLKVQTFALEILLVLSIDGEAKALLQQNTTFIQDLKTMISTSDTPAQRKAADGILWQLFLKHQKAEYQFQYDVMISYSHKDKDVCHRIHKALTDSKFRVWIDLEGMHGAMMQVMADAVKRSRCILICMSESYYLSPYCQAEAQYGFDKQRVLIPIKVQSGYKPDGWLEFVTACRMYVDFTKTDFDTAYTKVVSEITQSEAVEKESSSMASRTPTSKGPTIK
jgi:TIR domain